MKSIFLFIFILCFTVAKSQEQTISINTKNTIHYKAKTINESAIQNYGVFSPDEKVIYEKVLGVDVDIYIDTIFNKYTILYKDKNYKSIAMIYEYVRDYFIEKDGKSGNTANTKMFLVDCRGSKFMLIDLSKNPIFNMIELRAEDKLANNCTWVFTIKNITL
jgi:hypothetical protein